MFTLGYRRWLDGLRAIAIITVFGFHLEKLQPVIGGTGAAGLDLFFVLSGFLITILLLEERRRTGTISLRAFYMRRVRRLVPALVLLLGAFIVLFQLDVPQATRHNSLGDVFPVAFYYGNWVKALTSTQLGMLGHTWSLSVEEQFYLAWPLLVIVLGTRKVVGGRLLALIGVSAVASAVWYEVVSRSGGTGARRAYFGTDTRGYALLFGCAVAVVMHYGLQPTALWWRRARTALGIAAAVYLVVFFLVPSLAPLSSRYPLLLAAIATALIVVHLCSTEEGAFHAILSVAPLVWIGRLSYGIYLFHFPVTELLTPERTGLDGGALAVLDIVVTTALAAASWFVVERRILKRRYVSKPMASAAAA